DGYIFTLGICGSASASGPAQGCLDLMLAALAPVKRAAYLGEILVREGEPSLDDPLLGPVCADIADAEVLLFATPLPGGALPARLLALAHSLAATPPPARRRFAALVVFTDGATTPLWPLRHALEAADIELLGELYAPADAALDELAVEAADLAHAAYARARVSYPGALP
ncbi:MAG: hypothetical protein WCG26_15920, partial [Chloroflexales bacterium]